MGSGSRKLFKKRDLVVMENISNQQDAKFMQYAQNFTQALSILTAKVEVLENIALEKGETKESLQERFFDRLDAINGVDKSPLAIQNGDRVRIHFAQGHEGDDLSTIERQNTILQIGANQIHENIDKALLGLKQGESFDVKLPPVKEGEKDVYLRAEVRAVYSLRPEAPTENEIEVKEGN